MSARPTVDAAVEFISAFHEKTGFFENDPRPVSMLKAKFASWAIVEWATEVAVLWVNKKRPSIL